MTEIRRRRGPPPPSFAQAPATAEPTTESTARAASLDRAARPMALDGGPTAPLGARPAAPGASAPPDPLRARRELARALVKLGGGANEEDIAPVLAELVKLPAQVLRALAQTGFEPGTARTSTARQTQVVVCRGSVTDHLQYLRGKQPPGWPPGTSWDDVPGVYAPQANNVVIATVADTNRGRIVPESPSQHGGRNLVVHEVMHAYLALTGIDAAFVIAQKQDAARLPAAFRDESLDAHTELYAEAAARYFSGDAALFEEWPALGSYFFTRFPPGADAPRGRP